MRTAMEIKTVVSCMCSATAVALLFGFTAPLAAQETTFHACYVPNVGAVYMIKLEGTPANCLSDSHVEISWTNGSVADGSIGTTKLADGAVTTSKLANAAVTTEKLAPDARNERLFAVVNEDGTLARGTAVASESAATGIYDVAFDRDVSECAYIATVGRADDSLGAPAVAQVNRDPTDPKGVRVSIFAALTQGASTTPRPFHLQVDC